MRRSTADLQINTLQPAGSKGLSKSQFSFKALSACLQASGRPLHAAALQGVQSALSGCDEPRLLCFHEESVDLRSPSFLFGPKVSHIKVDAYTTDLVWLPPRDHVQLLLLLLALVHPKALR